MDEKIQMAKCGNQVTICPEELSDAEFEGMVPLTVADLIGICTTFNIPYLLTDNPPAFTFNPPIS